MQAPDVVAAGTRPQRGVLDQFTADALFVDTHRQDLVRRYPDQWIAVHQGEIVVAAGEIEELPGQIERAGLPAGHVYREFLSSEDEVPILSSRARAVVP
jgi:hypothetical protein